MQPEHVPGGGSKVWLLAGIGVSYDIFTSRAQHRAEVVLPQLRVSCGSTFTAHFFRRLERWQFSWPLASVDVGCTSGHFARVLASVYSASPGACRFGVPGSRGLRCSRILVSPGYSMRVRVTTPTNNDGP
jgi:hypothetical protein